MLTRDALHTGLCTEWPEPGAKPGAGTRLAGRRVGPQSGPTGGRPSPPRQARPPGERSLTEAYVEERGGIGLKGMRLSERHTNEEAYGRHLKGCLLGGHRGGQGVATARARRLGRGAGVWQERERERERGGRERERTSGLGGGGQGGGRPCSCQIPESAVRALPESGASRGAEPRRERERRRAEREAKPRGDRRAVGGG